MLVRVIRFGHTPRDAQAWAQRIPAWRNAPTGSVTAFATALAGLWRERQNASPATHRGPLADAAEAWVSYRRRPASSLVTIITPG